jgi:hypothetical protein
MNHVYTVEADVLYVARGHKPIWLPEKLNVIGNGSVDVPIRKAKSVLMRLRTWDAPAHDATARYGRQAKRVKITSVTQGVEVDIL